LPIDIASGNYKIHKILVAQGASEASQNYFFDNIFGNLRIKYGTSESDSPVQFPFTLFLSKHDPVHVLDARSLAIVLRELDTAFDFTEYLLVKERDIQKHSALSYPGEENLLAYYLFHFDERNNQHYISVVDDSTSVLSIAADWWEGLMEDPDYKRKKAADEISYLWDLLMHDVCKLAFEGTTTGNANLFSQQNAIYEMAKEPRYARQKLAEEFLRSFEKQKKIPRNQSFMLTCKSHHEETAYVFLWVRHTSKVSEELFIKARTNRLAVACGMAKNAHPQFTKIVGITFGFTSEGGVAPGDFLLMECKEWTEEDKSRCEELSKAFGFFRTAPDKLPPENAR
ncbi:MAG: hypothetical protein MPJ22_09975, partial [Pirellulales bacterium]|nr:hypothetical protein [Pirellulales bacterium]